METTRYRKKNLTPEQTLRLLTLILINIKLLDGKYSHGPNAVTKQSKRALWDKIADEINSMGRSTEEIQKRWNDLRLKAIKFNTTRRQTGGGPPPNEPPYYEQIMDILSEKKTLLNGVPGTDDIPALGWSAWSNAAQAATSGIPPVGARASFFPVVVDEEASGTQPFGFESSSTTPSPDVDQAEASGFRSSGTTPSPGVVQAEASGSQPFGFRSSLTTSTSDVVQAEAPGSKPFGFKSSRTTPSPDRVRREASGWSFEFKNSRTTPSPDVVQAGLSDCQPSEFRSSRTTPSPDVVQAESSQSLASSPASKAIIIDLPPHLQGLSPVPVGETDVSEQREVSAPSALDVQISASMRRRRKSSMGNTKEQVEEVPAPPPVSLAHGVQGLASMRRRRRSSKDSSLEQTLWANFLREKTAESVIKQQVLLQKEKYYQSLNEKSNKK